MPDSSRGENPPAPPLARRDRAGGLGRWLTALALAVIAVLASVVAWAELTDYRPVPAVLADAEVVWCDAHRALVALGAETLELLPDELASEPTNLVRDDTDDPSEYTATALETMRLVREGLELTPPSASGDVGFPTSSGFQPYRLLGVRSVAQANHITQDWIAGLEGAWDHPHAVATCRATYEAFR